MHRFIPLALAAALSPMVASADQNSPYGINTHIPSTSELDKVAEAGIGWIRVDFNWYQMEPSRDNYQWSTTDRVVNEARARGLEVFATLAYTPSWANGGQDIAVPPSNPADWADFVQDTVNRYKGSISHWGMWNEPNLPQFFTGDVDTYINDILRPGAAAARAASSGAVIAGPDLAHVSSENWAAWLYTVLDEAGSELDVITHHIYEDNGMEVIRTLGLWVPLWERPQVVKIIEVTGQDNKPFWLTETGWRTEEISDEAQARNYEQALDGMHKHDWLDKIFFYELTDDPNITHEWGVLNSDLSPKDAYWAYRDYISEH